MPKKPVGILLAGLIIVAAAVCCAQATAEQAGSAERVKLLSTFDDGSFWAVAVQDGLAYAGGRYAGLTILDVTTPSSPTVVSRAECCAADITLVPAARGDSGHSYAYMTDWAGLRVVDVTDPTDPIHVRLLGTPDLSHGVEVEGDLACLAVWREGMWVLDVSDPGHPTKIGHHNIPGIAYDVDISGTIAYVAAGGGLEVIDVSDPVSPSRLSTYELLDNAWDVQVRDGLAYVVGETVSPYDGWLAVLDVSDPSRPSEIGRCEFSDPALGMDMSGDHVYVAAQIYGGLRVVDVSVPSKPVEVGYYERRQNPYGDTAWNVAVGDNTAYLAYDQTLLVLSFMDDQSHLPLILRRLGIDSD